MRRPFLLALAALAAALLWPGAAAAHAGLVLAEPPAGAVLDAPPPQVLLTFSERLDPQYSRLQLVDEWGTIIATTTRGDPEQPSRLLLTLGPLPHGSYTAIWRVRSAEDGHITEGVVPFGVGVAADLAAVLPAPGAPAPALAPPPLIAALSRWLALVGAALAIGAVCFGLWVWRPAWRQAPAAPEADARMLGAIRRLCLAGAALLLLAGPLALISLAAGVAGDDGALLTVVPGVILGWSGALVLARLLATVALAALVLRLPTPGAGAAMGWRLCVAVGAGLLLTFPLSGHGASAGDLAPALIAAGFAHTAAMAVWFGGVATLLAVVALARGEQTTWPGLGLLVRRFSPLAVAAVVVAALSGGVAAWAHIGSPELLTTTTYGRALLVKSGAFLALLGLGALHMLVVGPRLRPGAAWASRMRLTLGAEAALALVLLAAAATQLSTAPSRTAWAAQAQLGRRIEEQVDAVGLVLWVTPAQAGDNLLALDITDGRGGAAGDPEVLLRFAMAEHPMAPLEAEAEAVGGGRFQARGSYLSMIGRWEVEAIVRREGLADARHTFIVDVR